MIYSIIYINFKWGNFKSVPIKVRARRGHPVSPPFPLQVLTLGVLANAIRKEKTLDHKPNHSYSQFRTFNFTVQQWPCEATRKCLWVVWLELLDSQCETGHFHAMLGGGWPEQRLPVTHTISRADNSHSAGYCTAAYDDTHQVWYCKSIFTYLFPAYSELIKM